MIGKTAWSLPLDLWGTLEAAHRLEQIYLEHKDLVFRAAYRVTGNLSDAEDVLQTVFLRLVRLNLIPGGIQGR